ncbi:hypothetical protein ElyMa_006827400 [Elysia marginata]|uniref:Uncharacterized protein n=1 Tax=Elysia marginata TaxID=1093978 RepID=A0AAV4J7L0_9GAST|nr:hypothetical protein ElyMa_006827400 [Elysia marginata]
MLPGHTKPAPDRCFGLLKKKFRTNHVSSLQEMADYISASTRPDINLAQLVGDENCRVFVPTYDWRQFFKGLVRPRKGLQHFHFNQEPPACCTAQPKDHNKFRSCTERRTSAHYGGLRSTPDAALETAKNKESLDIGRMMHTLVARERYLRMENGNAHKAPMENFESVPHRLKKSCK